MPLAGRSLFRAFGRRAIPPALSIARKVAVQKAIFQARKTFLAGAQAVIETMLQSPSFIFWLEQSPEPEMGSPMRRLPAFLISSGHNAGRRLAATSGPTENLEPRKASEDDNTAHAPESQGKSRRRRVRFRVAALRSRDESFARNGGCLPLFSQELAKTMTEETRRFISDLIWNDRNFMEAFTANYSFINSDLAPIYKVSAPARDFATGGVSRERRARRAFSDRLYS